MPVDPSPLFFNAFVALVFACATGLVGLVWRAYRSMPARVHRRATIRAGASMVALLMGTLILAGTGIFRRWELPPPLMLMLFGLIGLNVWLACFSGFGRRLALGLPLWVLIGAQAFRLPVELMLHAGAEEGFIPVQLTWEGRNFDVATACLAIILAVWAYLRERRDDGEPPAWAQWAFNGVGLGLLFNVVAVAALSMPTPLRQFTNEPPNVWVAYPPYVWLPAVLVQFALLGHLVLGRRLIIGRNRSSATAQPPAD